MEDKNLIWLPRIFSFLSMLSIPILIFTNSITLSGSVLIIFSCLHFFSQKIVKCGDLDIIENLKDLASISNFFIIFLTISLIAIEFVGTKIFFSIPIENISPTDSKFFLTTLVTFLGFFYGGIAISISLHVGSKEQRRFYKGSVFQILFSIIWFSFSLFILILKPLIENIIINS